MTSRWLRELWQLLSWLLELLGNQQQLYWICRIFGASSTRKDFKYLYHLSVVKWQKMQIYFLFSWNKISMAKVKIIHLRIMTTKIMQCRGKWVNRYFGILTPCGDIDLGHHWLGSAKWCLFCLSINVFILLGMYRILFHKSFGIEKSVGSDFWNNPFDYIVGRGLTSVYLSKVYYQWGVQSAVWAQCDKSIPVWYCCHHKALKQCYILKFLLQ